MNSGHPDDPTEGSPSGGDHPPHVFVNDPVYQLIKEQSRQDFMERSENWRNQWTTKGIVRMNDYRGLTEVLVETGALLETVKENLTNHRNKFELAVAGYKIRAIEILNDHIERIMANAPEKVVVSLPWPEDHSADYERVIEMLKWSTDTHLELNEHEFATYVLDQWGWQEKFTTTAAMYSGS